MPTIQLEIKTVPISLNTFFSRGHWTKRNELARKFDIAIGVAIKNYQEERGIKYGSDSMRIKGDCKMEFQYPKKWKQDLDNLSALEKLIIDGLKDMAIAGVKIWNVFGDDKCVIEIKKSYYMGDTVKIYISGPGTAENHLIGVVI